MDNIKTNLKSLNVLQYVEIASNSVVNADPLAKYLLFTQLTQYMGMSLPTSILLFFGGVYLTQNETNKRIKESIEETEPVIEEPVVEEPVVEESSGILSYFW